MSLNDTARRWFALAGLLLALAACDAAANPSQGAPSPSSVAERCDPDVVAEGGITGTVVNEAGEPLGDILITIDANDLYGSARTAEDGVFNAPGVSGEFVISTTDIDYAEATQAVTVPCGELVEVEFVLTPIGG
ncbi:MAG: carboxypeptidase-like regulatory domain-containing protein [Candidatus Limnocylindria bacterium]